MAQLTKSLLVCNCRRTMDIDGEALGEALGREPIPVHSELCRAQISAVEREAAAGDVLVACTQEAPLFAEVADEGCLAGALSFVNIRERAGWGASPDKRHRRNVQAKIAAQLAEAMHVSIPAGLLTLNSEGRCLVYGEGQTALDAAVELADRLSVTLLLSDTGDAQAPLHLGRLSVARGRVRRLTGYLGAFEVEVERYAPALPSSRSLLEFATPHADIVRSTCDIVIDLSRDTLLADHRRDGYLRADPGSPVAVMKALLTATDLTGEHLKPLYVGYEPSICAHSRNRKQGCSRCLEVCPTGAITSTGDHVAIEPAVCGGCGLCSTVCPTGAVSYAYPRRADVVGRAGLLLKTYRAAGGTHPVVLVHDGSRGLPLIAAIARYGRGLPGHVLPLEVNAVGAIGHDQIAALLAFGAERVVLLMPHASSDEVIPVEREAGLMLGLLGGLGYPDGGVIVITESDPDNVESLLYALSPSIVASARSFSVGDGKRELARMALTALWEMAPAPRNRIALEAGAPYGRISIRTAGCTLCLACVGACPTGALSDNPERPQVSFTEAACVQCGICAATCPERVISLEPSYDFTAAKLTPRVLHSEEPFCCVRCAKPFASPSSIARLMARLEGHSMFRDEGRLALIQMCDICRIETLASRQDDPLKAGERPRVRTTDDYLQAEARSKETGRKPEDFLS